MPFDQRDNLAEKITSLLNKYALYLDMTEVDKTLVYFIQKRKSNFDVTFSKVLTLLPEYWSIEMLNEFLSRSLRQSYHEYRGNQILKGLSRGENTVVCQIRFEFFEAFPR